MSSPVAIHAIERGRAPSNLPRSARAFETAHFDVVLIPVAPIHVGQEVQIFSLEARSTPNVMERRQRAQPEFTAIPTGITGRVVGIRTMELAVTEFVVRNEADQSLVDFAYLTVQHAEGTTVTMETWRRIARTILLPILPHTRHVPILRNAVVVPEEE